MILSVPTFARLSDYLGAWCLEERAFARLFELTQRLDLKAHVADGAEGLKSAIETAALPGGKKIALIKATGVLMKSQSSMGGTSTVQLRRDIRGAAADSDVAGILLVVDSPGGTVAGTDELAREVKAAGRVKPVWAHAEDLMASAAYWAASQAERVTANSPTAIVGSIGTIQVIYDTSAAADADGVRTIVVRTGPLKGLGADGDKVTDEQVAHVQGLVDSVQESFDAAVKAGRKLSAQQLADVRHGGVLTAPAALGKGLIDAIQPLGKTMAEFAAALKTAGAKAHVVVPALAGPPVPRLFAMLPTVRRTLPVKARPAHVALPVRTAALPVVAEASDAELAPPSLANRLGDGERRGD